MSDDPYNAMPAEAPQGFKERAKEKMGPCVKKAAKYCGGLIVVGMLVLCLVQLITWEVGNGGCSASKVAAYDYSTWPTDSDELKSKDHNASFNVLSKYVSLVDNKPVFRWWMPQAWFGMESLTVYASTRNAAAAVGTTGNFWRTQGPLFNTYVYENEAGQQLLTGREKLLTLGISHAFWKCDGTGPVIIVAEGMAWLGNRMRSFFGTSQGFKFNVYVGDEFVGYAQETGNRFNPAISFTTTGANGQVKEFASSTLNDRHFHGSQDQWYIRSSDWSPVPYYAPVFTTLILAIRVAHVKTADQEAHKTTPSPVYGLSEQSSDFTALQPEFTEKTQNTLAKNESTEAVEEAAKVTETVNVNTVKTEERLHV